MAVIVVCGGGKDVGKTAVVCRLIAGLREFGWTAVKVTSHAHGKAEAVWEETEAGEGTDTARYLAAGARRALLVSAGDDELEAVVERLRAEPEVHWIFESNRILRYLRPDVCLAVEGGLRAEAKPSFLGVARPIDAWVGVAERGGGVARGKVRFELAALDRVSAEMVGWVRGRLDASTQGKSE